MNAMMLWIMFCILCAWWTSLFCSIAKHVKVLTKWLIWCQINCWVQTIARRRTPGAEPCNDKPLLEPISMVKLYMEPFFTTGQKENSVPYQSFSVTLRSPRFIATLCSVISLLHCNIFFFLLMASATSFSPCLDNLGHLVLVPLFITV